ncbi:YoaK family protein [Cellulomonas sp. ES6]|uniref:YoaK family protein n=1 Tax=Cellulomonas sp. ES6 TaxID=3039384 RepID=UPI0024B6DF4A|nr:YoaK family protein [Cellulomonas sp. ES6]WHP17129.1 YoaK family protein [Cellulomonas sp. ES6]
MVRVRSRAEHPATGVALAVVGGFLDAYTFVAHDGVFANAQTGNVVLVAVAWARGDGAHAARYLPIIATFVLGLVAAEVLAAHRHRRWLHDPTRLVLGTEIAVLLAVAALPRATPHLVTTCAVSFVAALQVTTFRLVRDTSYSTTMTTGNLRTLVTAAYEWLTGYDPAQRAVVARLSAVVLAFAAGAGAGALASGPDALGTRATVLAAVVLAGVLTAVETHTRRHPHTLVLAPVPGRAAARVGARADDGAD